MMTQVNEAFEVEREFIMNVSHELLTPVSILRTRIENLLTDPSLPNDAADKLVESQKTLSRLTKVVKALLYISRIENEQFVKNEKVSVKTLIEEVLEELDEWLMAKNIKLRNEISEDWICSPCNKSLLHTLFFNLLSNGIKYNIEGGELIISNSRKDGAYVLSVSDTGLGIESAHIPFIFDRFKRFKPEDGKSFGLGLPIVKTIASFHGLDIRVESERSRGTTFFISFP